MSQTTHIAWANHTASPWFGCTEVSPGCANCYARELTLNHKWAGWGDKSPRVRSKGFWKDAYRWDRAAGVDASNWGDGFREICHQRPRIFTSLMDWLDPMVPIELLADFLEVVANCQNLDWLLLTKRPENFVPLFQTLVRLTWVKERRWIDLWLNGAPPPHVWFGVTVENQAMADERIPILLSIPAKVRWLSVEPLLEEVWLEPWLTHPKNHRAGNTPFPGYTTLDWVVVGGESGSKRRDPGVEPLISVAEQCKAAGVPCFTKQDCAQRPGQQGRIPAHIWAMKEFPAVNQRHVWPKERG